MILFLCFFALFPWFSVNADSLYVKNVADLQPVEEYFNNLKTLKFTFTQKDPYNKIAKGLFYLKRPDKIRIEYETEIPVVLVVNGKIVTYYDKSLDQKSSILTKQTIASILTSKNFSFADKAIEIKDVRKYDAGLVVDIQKSDAAEEGVFSLFFRTTPKISLEKILIKSPNEDVVEVMVIDYVENTDIATDLFIIKDKSIDD